MKWTSDTEKALQQAAAGSKNATKKLYKKWISYLNKLTAMTRVKLHVIDRNKVVILCYNPYMCILSFLDKSLFYICVNMLINK